MIARLQRWVTLALVLGAVAWAYGFWCAGHPAIAVAGAVILLFGHAFVLAAEFSLLVVLRKHDAAPVAPARQLLRAWCAEVLIAPRVFCWRQPFRATAVADWLPDANPMDLPSRGIVLVHGFACNRAFWNPWMMVLRTRGVPFVGVNLEPPFGSIADYGTAIAAAVCAVRQATGVAPVIVAHSMGGLAVRAWLVHCKPDEMPARVITIGTPHQGTWLARFGLATNSTQMRIGAEWQRTLCRSERREVHARFICFYSNCDNMILPPSNATLTGADNRHIPGCAHVDLAFHPDIMAEAVKCVRLA